MALKSQNKVDSIDGTISKPAITDPQFFTSDIVNSMICFWLVNSLDDLIRAHLSRLTNVKAMWDCLKTRYSIKNGPKIYKLWSNLKQSGTSAMCNYTKLLGMWEDLSNISPLESCNCDRGSKVITWFDNLKTYQFFMGLDESYDTIRTQIINKEPLPDLD